MPIYRFHDFELDEGQRQLRSPGGEPVTLSPRHFDALLYFVERPGQLLDKDSLLAALWPGLVVEENSLSQTVSTLRRALEDNPQASRFIQTVPRRGFRFVAPVTSAAAATSQSAAAERPVVAESPGDV
ncbi:MAG: transcriptional regulator, partial [Pseudomonadota bacterium]|nr:transcriptional regulator [Pseudomonadota bacterium]